MSKQVEVAEELARALAEFDRKFEEASRFRDYKPIPRETLEAALQATSTPEVDRG